MANSATDLTHRLPTTEEIQSAAEAASALAQAKSHDGFLTVGGVEDSRLRLAPAISDLLVDLLGHVARGEMVTLVPVGAILTTQEAADMLNVSRPYLSNLLKQQAMPFIQVGSHRRIKLKDLMDYKHKRDEVRADALNLLARLGQEFDAA